MKHVGSAARDGFRLLVTGFEAFPGAPVNPTIAILEALKLSLTRLEGRGIDLRCEVMPVVYGEIAGTLRRLVVAHRPEAILHLGLAAARTSVCVETRAVNRAHLTHPDAEGIVPEQPKLCADGPETLTATSPAAKIARAIRQIGVPVRRSVNAGTYVCNATLYHSLREGLAPQVGFLHVPHPGEGSGRDLADLARAVEETIIVMALHAPRRHAAVAPTAPQTALSPGGRRRP